MKQTVFFVEFRLAREIAAAGPTALRPRSLFHEVKVL